MSGAGQDGPPCGVPAADTESLVHAWRARGGRITSERRDLLTVMAEVDRPLTALQVSELLVERIGRSVDLSTVHRNLRHLHSCGLAYRVAVGGSAGQASSAYRLHERELFTALCTGCDTVVALPPAVATRAARALARAAEFQIRPGSPVFLGRCRSCTDTDTAGHGLTPHDETHPDDQLPLSGNNDELAP